jgi:membrane protein implicated in regulation of membrane protease activity
VIVAAIIAVLAAPALYLVGLWTLFGEWLATIWSLLAASTLVPNWLLGLFAICAIIVAGLLGTSLRPRRESPDPDRCEGTDS